MWESKKGVGGIGNEWVGSIKLRKEQGLSYVFIEKFFIFLSTNEGNIIFLKKKRNTT